MKSKTKKKKITTDVLAGMVQRGFLDNKKSFEQIDSRFEQIDSRFDRVEGQLGKLGKDVNQLKEDFHKILVGFDKVAKHYADYVEEIKLRDAEIKRLKRWVEQIAEKVGVKLEV